MKKIGFMLGVLILCTSVSLLAQSAYDEIDARGASRSRHISEEAKIKQMILSLTATGGQGIIVSEGFERSNEEQYSFLMRGSRVRCV